MSEIRDQAIQHVNKGFRIKNGSFSLKTHLNPLAAEYSAQAFHTTRMGEVKWKSKSSGCIPWPQRRT